MRGGKHQLKDRLLKAFGEIPVSREGLRSLRRDDVNWIIRREVDWMIIFLEAEREVEHVSKAARVFKPDSASLESLNRVFKIARQFHDAVNSMPPSAWLLLKDELGSLPPTHSSIIARARLGDLRRRSKGGRPVDPTTRTAAALAEQAARSYELLTGKKATPGFNPYSGERSKFERFLADVFASIGIEASAEAHAKHLRAREKTASK